MSSIIKPGFHLQQIHLRSIYDHSKKKTKKQSDHVVEQSSFPLIVSFWLKIVVVEIVFMETRLKNELSTDENKVLQATSVKN